MSRWGAAIVGCKTDPGRSLEVRDWLIHQGIPAFTVMGNCDDPPLLYIACHVAIRNAASFIDREKLTHVLYLEGNIEVSPKLPDAARVAAGWSPNTVCYFHIDDNHDPPPQKSYGLKLWETITTGAPIKPGFVRVPYTHYAPLTTGKAILMPAQAVRLALHATSEKLDRSGAHNLPSIWQQAGVPMAIRVPHLVQAGETSRSYGR